MIVICVPCYWHITLGTLVVDGGRREEEIGKVVFNTCLKLKDCDLCAMSLTYYNMYSSRGWREEGRGDWKSRDLSHLVVHSKHI